MQNWERTEYNKIHRRGSPIKKWQDEWVWQPVTLGSSTRQSRRNFLGKILNDDIYECGFCSGTGEKPKGSRCSVCGGKGTVSVSPPAVICAYCKGRGEEKPRTNVTCTVCRGKGVVSVQEPIEICHHCRGRGAEPTNKLPCIVCKGKGVVTIKEEVESRQYLDLEKEPRYLGLFAQQHQAAPKNKQQKKIYHLPSGSEKEALEIIYELEAADRAADGAAVGARMNISSFYADYLCRSLVKGGLLILDSRKYALTPAGEKLLGKK